MYIVYILGLYSIYRYSINYTILNTRNNSAIDIIEVLLSLAYLLVINIEYKAVLYLYPLYYKAVSLVGLIEYLYKIYYKKPEVRRQAEDWIQGLKKELR